jgi:YbgC/YbaW family acyl-CoA thioester hydrolase
VPTADFPREVRFQDVDASGFVSVAQFFEYAHDAYAELLTRGGVRFGDVVVAERRWGAPLVHVEGAFHAPAVCGDALTVRIEGIRFGKTSLTVRFSLHGPEDRPVCTLATTHAFIDGAMLPRPIPDEVRGALAHIAD